MQYVQSEAVVPLRNHARGTQGETEHADRKSKHKDVENVRCHD